MQHLPDPDWYLDNVLVFAEPGAPISRSKGAAARWQGWWRMQVGGEETLRMASRHGFVLTTNELSALGVSRSTARHAVARGRWTVPQRGFVAPVRLDDGSDRHVVGRRVHAVTATAAVRSVPGLVISARSAAILRGLPTVAIPSRPEVTSTGSADRVGCRPTRHTFGADLDAEATDSWFGIPCTTVGRTLVDLARHDRRDAVMAADAALHENLVTRAAIEATLETAVGWPGVRQARDVLALTSALAESPLESLVRLALHDSGFPPPQLQVLIGGYRVNLCWPDRGLIVEVDGLGKYSDEAWRQEKRREQVLRALGYRVERVTSDDLSHRWPATVARLRRELHL